MFEVGDYVQYDPKAIGGRKLFGTVKNFESTGYWFITDRESSDDIYFGREYFAPKKELLLANRPKSIPLTHIGLED
jgi:hypothetical protein